MRRKGWIFNVEIYLSDFVTILLSYVIAVILRYKVMDSDPGINALSLPYMITAVIYSFVMASVIHLLDKAEKKYRYRTDYRSGINTVITQLIGSLALLSFFYVANAIYFSRVALVVFWLVSCVLLIIKDAFMRKKVYDAQKNGNKKINVLVVGTGKAAKEFIRSAVCYSNYGYHLIGYLAEKKTNEEEFLNEVNDLIIDTCGMLGGECGFDKFDNIPLGQFSCCGEYSDLAGVLDKGGVDEAVFCTDSIDDAALDQMVKVTRDSDVDIFFAGKQNKFLTADANVLEVGGVRLLSLKSGKQHDATVFLLGLTISIAMLLLFMLMKALNPDASSGFKRFASYKSLLFAVTAIFMYGFLAILMKAVQMKNVIRCSITTLAVGLLMVGVYEFAFYAGKIPIKTLRGDMIITVVTVLVMGLFNTAIAVIGKDDSSLLF